MAHSDEFELYDLKVEVEAIEGHCTCTMQVGDCFFLRSGKLALPNGRDFCLYALQATIPLLPAKQRRNHAAARSRKTTTKSTTLLLKLLLKLFAIPVWPDRR
jgi:uncharacterized repeat protein (TIGR04076 family)